MSYQKLKMILYEGKTYYDSEPIEWEVAIDFAGNYFAMARYFGLPKPPACLIFCSENIEDMTHEQMIIIADYHRLYEAAEKCEIEN